MPFKTAWLLLTSYLMFIATLRSSSNCCLTDLPWVDPTSQLPAVGTLQKPASPELTYSLDAESWQ